MDSNLKELFKNKNQVNNFLDYWWKYSKSTYMYYHKKHKGLGSKMVLGYRDSEDSEDFYELFNGWSETIE